jgi:hypothetical protein
MAEYAHKTEGPAGRLDSARRSPRTASQLKAASPGAQDALQTAMNGTPAVQSVAQLKHALNHSQRVSDVAQLVSALHRDAAPHVVLPEPMQTVQRAAIEDEEIPVQGKFPIAQREAIEDEEVMQPKAATAQRARASGGVAENRSGMPDGLKSSMESMSGFDLSDVRVHANSDRPASLNALAYAQGSDIHLAPGQDHHLAHEAWHVVQQRQGRVPPTMQLQGVNINDDTSLESEADRMGAKASQLKRDPDPSAR